MREGTTNRRASFRHTSFYVSYMSCSLFLTVLLPASQALLEIEEGVFLADLAHVLSVRVR